MSVAQRLRRIVDKLGANEPQTITLYWPDYEGNVSWQDKDGTWHTETEAENDARCKASGEPVIQLRWPEEMGMTDAELREYHRKRHEVEKRRTAELDAEKQARWLAGTPTQADLHERWVAARYAAVADGTWHKGWDWDWRAAWQADHKATTAQ